MRRLVLIFLALILATAALGEPASLWTHNGSIMSLYADGLHRQFRYDNPRQGMRNVGVRPGTLLFQGSRSGNAYTGTAYVFSRRCGAVPYQVSGQTSADERSLTLYGTAPAGFNTACLAIAFRDDVLRFELLNVLTPPSPEPQITARSPHYRPTDAVIDAPLLGEAMPKDSASLGATTAHYGSSPAAGPPRAQDSPGALLERIQSATAVVDARWRWLAAVLLLLLASGYLMHRFDPGVHAVNPPSAPATSWSLESGLARQSPPAPEPTSTTLPIERPFGREATMTLDMPPPLPVPTARTVADKIHLKIRRSQKSGVFGGKPTFVLDARVDLSPEAQTLVAKYGLGSTVVYDSKARRQHTEAAYAHFDAAVAHSYSSAARSYWSNAKGVASAVMMALSLRITIDKLVAGQHIECKDLDELLGAEAALAEACKNLRAYLDTAATFDGREDLLEF